LSIDLKKIIRSRKPENHRTKLTARSDTALIRASDIAGKGRQVFVPDKNMPLVAFPRRQRPSLTKDDVPLCGLPCGTQRGRRNYTPKAAEWQTVADHYVDMFASIPANRLLVPDSQIRADAGMVAGVLARTQNFQKQQLDELLNDALVYLCAGKYGFPVLTNNKADFDLLQQIAPGGTFIFV
jgi:hypothetical protein